MYAKFCSSFVSFLFSLTLWRYDMSLLSLIDISKFLKLYLDFFNWSSLEGWAINIYNNCYKLIVMLIKSLRTDLCAAPPGGARDWTKYINLLNRRRQKKTEALKLYHSTTAVTGIGYINDLCLQNASFGKNNTLLVVYKQSGEVWSGMVS